MSEKKNRWFKDLFKSRDRNVILICIGIALILWLTTKFAQEYAQDYSFSLIYDLPDNLSFSQIPEDEFDAQLSGQGWELLKASMRRGFSKVHIPVRRTDITRTDLVQALYQHLGDSEVQVREVNIDVIHLDTDLRVQKSVPFVYDGGVRFAEGYQVRDSIIIEPTTAIITGPAANCDKINAIHVKGLGLPVLQSDFRKSITIESPDPFVTIEPSQVDMIIQADMEVRLEFAVPIRVVGDSIPVSLTPSEITIRCTIGNSKQEKTHPGLFDAVVIVDADCLSNGRCQVEILDSPEHARSITIQPSYVQVKVVESDSTAVQE